MNKMNDMEFYHLNQALKSLKCLQEVSVDFRWSEKFCQKMIYEHNRYEGFSERGLSSLIKGFRRYTSLRSLRLKFPKYHEI